MLIIMYNMVVNRGTMAELFVIWSRSTLSEFFLNALHNKKINYYTYPHGKEHIIAIIFLRVIFCIVPFINM